MNREWFNAMSSFFNYRHLGFIACLLMLFANNAQAQKFCVFDVLGVQGPFYGTMLEYSTIARKWGVTLELKPYTNEEKAVEDFNAGVCDLISTTGIRARDFNLFSSSIEAIGGINNDAQMKSVIETISRPEAAKLMMQDGYEVAGVLPIGGVYLFLNDRSINSVDKIKGKKIAILAHDLVQLRLAKRLGFQALAADIDDFALKFNQGTADILPAPAIAYMPLELFKGVGNKGLVLKMPISYLSLQVVLRSDKFPANYGQKSRTYFNSMFDSLLKTTRQAEQEILYFFPAPDGEYDNYQALLRDARISMAQEGIYDTKMMSLLKKVRCKNQSNRAECTDGKE